MKNQKLMIITGVILLLVIALYAAFHYGLFIRGISQVEANQICQNFYNEVENDIKTINGFQVINGSNTCSPEQNELGSTDYIIFVEFKVSQPNPDSDEIIKKNINYLSKQLPHNDYPVWVDNMPISNGQPVTLCVSSSRYINSAGENFPQGPPTHYPRYTVPGSIKGFNPCQNI